MSIQQYRALKQGGPFALSTVPKPTPGPKQISVRPKAVALNPIDWKNLKFGAIVKSWPAVLGIDAAGIVESVGDGVTAFKPGDEVLTFANGLVGNGAFQEVYVVSENQAAKKPASLTFEEAASLPICFLTGAAAVATGLKVPLPGLSKTDDSIGKSLKSILVLGGSSAVGSAAIQLLRLALPSATIITTSSAAHHAHLKSLGATVTLERSAQQNSAVLKAATPGGLGVDAILDPLGAGAEAPAVYDAARPDGPKLYSLVLTNPGAKIPEGFQGAIVDGRDIYSEPDPLGYLARLVEEGKYKVPVKVDVVGKGFEAIEGGLDKLFKGVSGTKLVVSL
ncbi:hypothetical protein M426DRAFT_65272 [Hypoxylon sp. CI-4A]|nr:hypothetical protein M426DRAFT_65272 [Hypoxylon sp. CI-4A]